MLLYLIDYRFDEADPQLLQNHLEIIAFCIRAWDYGPRSDPDGSQTLQELAPE